MIWSIWSTGTLLRRSKEIVQDEQVPRELFLTTRHETKIRMTKYFNYEPRSNDAFSRTNKVKEHIGFHYLLIKIRLSTLILVELNRFHK